MKRVVGILAVVLAAWSNGMADTAITVPNFGFENPVLTDGFLVALGAGNTYSWLDANGTAWPGVYIFNTTTNVFSSIPEGTNVGYIDTRPNGPPGIGSAIQTNIATIDETKSYTLKVMVGQSKTSPFPPECYARLLKSSVVARDIISRVVPAPDSWNEISVTYNPVPGDGGKMLGIQVGNSADLVNSAFFMDNVRLSYSNRTAMEVIDVPNGSFENPVMTNAGGYVQLNNSGLYSWYDAHESPSRVWAVVYIVKPFTNYFSSVPDGSNIAWLDMRDPGTKNSVLQTNIFAINGNAVYTLKAMVGKSLTDPFPPNYYVNLLKGTNVAASYTSTVAPTAGGWTEVTVTYSARPADTGQMLGIQMGCTDGVTGAYIFFDNVRLSYSIRHQGTLLMFR